MRPQFICTYSQLACNVFLLLSFLLLASCSKFNCSRLEDVLGGPTNLINFSYSIADSLIENAFPPLMPNHPEMVVLTTTFVDNNNLERTTRFGRLLQEHIRSRFVQDGFTVKDIKIGKTLYIEPKSGETILTRDLTQLRSDQDAQAIVVGTFSRSNRILYISSRLINPTNNNIMASVDHRLCMDDEILDLFGLEQLDESDTLIQEPSQPFLNKIL